MSRLTQVFRRTNRSEKAVAAFYRTLAPAETPVPTGRSILCVDYNCDVLAYLRELRAALDTTSVQQPPERCSDPDGASRILTSCW